MIVVEIHNNTDNAGTEVKFVSALGDIIYGQRNLESGASRCMTVQPPRGKTNKVVSEQARHKLACTSTEKS